MPENLTLDEFLRRLGAERGLHRRVRLLGRYWKQVQSLPPEQRERVALALGSQALWGRLEKLFSRDGTLSEGELSVKRALDSVGQADPDELRALARKVRSGNYTEVGKDLARAVGDALEEEAAAGDAPPERHPQATVSESQDEEEAKPEEPQQERPSEATARPESGEFDTARPSTEEAEPSETPAGPAPSPSTSEPHEQPPAHEQPRAIEPPPPAHEQPRAIEPPFPERPHPIPAAPERRAKRPRAAARFSAAESLAELRRLRDSPDHGAQLGSDGRARLLDRLNAGWARRRGLSQLIRGDSIGDLDEALRLIDGLETPVQRSWCLGDLMQHWDLDEDETARVLEAAPSSATRRRLQRRAQGRA